MTWANGRSLTHAESYAGTVDFAYDLNGLRRSKTVGNVEHNYLYAGGKLLRETYGNNTLDFFYDANGTPYALKHNGTVYYYITNLQGDVIQIVNANGETVAAYEYDPYGKVISSTGTLAEINPIRYRGYYYDTETGFYYLQSRYYDPKIGRFVNVDSVIAGVGSSILGYNMFAYCYNNPVNMSDSFGHWPQWMEDAANWINEKVIQPAKQFIDDIKADASNYDKDNQSEEKVLASNYFSSYKGVPVFRINGDRSGSFGAIFVTRETNERTDAEDIIRHEYGHTKQLKELGLLNYTLGIMIPSWQEWGGGPYYSRPFELTADLYGRVQSRTHPDEDIIAGFHYLDTIKTSGPLIWLMHE